MAKILLAIFCLISFQSIAQAQSSNLERDLERSGAIESIVSLSCEIIVEEGVVPQFNTEVDQEYPVTEIVEEAYCRGMGSIASMTTIFNFARMEQRGLDRSYLEQVVANGNLSDTISAVELKISNGVQLTNNEVIGYLQAQILTYLINYSLENPM